MQFRELLRECPGILGVALRMAFSLREFLLGGPQASDSPFAVFGSILCVEIEHSPYAGLLGSRKGDFEERRGQMMNLGSRT